MKLTNILKKLHKKVTGIDIEKGNVTDILESMEENYAAQPSGGSEPTYETVAEIAVGEMEGQEGQYSYEAGIETVPEISESETYYLNDKSNPSTFFNHGSDVSMVGFNLKLDDGDPTRIDPSKPFVIVGFTDDVNDSLVVQSDTPDLSNTTVKILKVASAPSGGGEFVITGNITPTIDASGAITAIAWSNISVSSVDEVSAAIEAGKHVVLRGSFSPQAGVNLTFDFPMAARTSIPEGTMPDSFCFSGEIVLVGNREEDGFDVYDVASVLGQDESIYVQSAIKPQNVDHYEFGFAMSVDQQGNFTVTADQGSTFAAIKTALDVTPNVYAIVNSSGQRSRTIITADSESGLTLNTMHVSQEAFILLSVAMDSSNTITTVSKILT